MLPPDAVLGVKVGQVTGVSDGLQFCILCVVPDFGQEELEKWHKEKWQGGWGGDSTQKEKGSGRQAHRLQISARLSQGQDKQNF